MIKTSVMEELEEYNFMAALVYLIMINRGIFRTLSNILFFVKNLISYVWQGPKYTVVQGYGRKY